ncbi:MAG: ribonuclease HI [Treponema sp.]|jgi:ribonuclease HI|nr:ribonuclease HI [Treponema sp.]
MGLHIYTDGGCSGNPGPGGWAFLILREGAPVSEPVFEKWGAEQNTTNNRMELIAVIAALETALTLPQDGAPLLVYTDSQYVQKGITQWIHTWRRNGWQTSKKEPVKNQDLWRRLDEFSQRLAIQWHWVKGHGGNAGNERCDQLTHTAIGSLSRE